MDREREEYTVARETAGMSIINEEGGYSETIPVSSVTAAIQLR